MLRMPRLSEVLTVVLLCSSTVSGCGDDDSSDGDGGDGGGSGSAARDGSVGGSGGTGGLPRRDAGTTEEGAEGWPCTPSEPCNPELRCAATPFAINGTAVGVCAVPCEGNSECEGGQCITYSGAAADAHCVNIIDEEYELCGVADTSICSDELTCLYFPDYPLGVCVSLCTSGDEDAGVAGGAMCSGAQTCVEGILADPMPGEGVCGTLVERGAECGLEIGLYCHDGDVCAPEDPRDQSSTQRCFQDCSEAGAACEQGTCVVVQGLFAYCAS